MIELRFELNEGTCPYHPDAPDSPDMFCRHCVRDVLKVIEEDK